MGDDALDRDARIKLSIGTKQEGNADGQFNYPMGLSFDHHRDLLLVADKNNNRVQVFSCADGDEGGSFVSKFGKQGSQQASSSIRRALRSITIMTASSSLIPAIIEYNHGH